MAEKNFTKSSAFILIFQKKEEDLHVTPKN